MSWKDDSCPQPLSMLSLPHCVSPPRHSDSPQPRGVRAASPWLPKAGNNSLNWKSGSPPAVVFVKPQEVEPMASLFLGRRRSLGTLHTSSPFMGRMAKAKQASAKTQVALQASSSTSLTKTCDLFCVLALFLNSEMEVREELPTRVKHTQSTLAAGLRIYS